MPADRVTEGLRSGSSGAPRSQNGRPPNPVPFYGSMGNVCCCPAFMLSQRLIVFLLTAGAGKGTLWYVLTFNIHVLRIYRVGQFCNHPGYRGPTENSVCIPGLLLFRLHRG